MARRMRVESCILWIVGGEDLLALFWAQVAWVRNEGLTAG